MLRVSTALHLIVAFDDITGHLANCNGNYNFFTCPYSVSQDSEVIVMTYSEVARKLHAWCPGPYRVLKMSAFITTS